MNKKQLNCNRKVIMSFEFIIAIIYVILGLYEFTNHNYAFACTIMFVAGCSLMLSLLYPNQEGDKEHKVKIKIKYFDDELTRIKKLPVGCWIDLRAAEMAKLKAGERKLIPLGVAMQLPDGYEAIVGPRSSTCKNFDIMQTNSFGVIDTPYCGDNDQWFFPAIALEDTTIHKNDRICQFRIQEVQPEIEFEEVECLGGKDRGGFGSTGVK